MDLPLWDLDLGTHTMRVVAVDEAGNRRQRVTSFTVGTSIQDVLILLDRFVEGGAIGAGRAAAVEAPVLRAERLLDVGRRAAARRQLQLARDQARNVGDADAHRILARDLTELIRDATGVGMVADTTRDATANLRDLDRAGDEPPALVDTPDVLVE